MVKLLGCNKVILSCHDNAPVLLLGRERKEKVTEGMANFPPPHPLNIQNFFSETSLTVIVEFIFCFNTENCVSPTFPQSTLGIVTYVAWKGDYLVLSDVDGNLSIWELKARVTR